MKYALAVLFLLIHVGYSEASSGFTLVFTGETKGYLELCGCSENLLGGLARRSTALEELRAQEGPVFLVSNGDIIASYGEQDEIKLGFILGAMERMGYGLINLGERDLAWEPEVFLRHLEKTGIPVLRSVSGADFHVKEINGIRVLFVGLSEQGLSALREREGGLAGLESLTKLKANDALKVLLFHGPIKIASRIAGEIPLFDVIVSGHGNEDPLPARRVDGTLILNYASKGKYLGVVKVGVSADGGYRLENRLVKLDKLVASSTEMLDYLKAYDKVLEQKKLVLKYSNRFPLKPGYRYQGSARCAECHERENRSWQDSHHTNAYKTLVAAGKQHDPECIQCHTIGYGKVSGFSVPGKRPDLRGVGCENCHGPGYPHWKKPEEFPLPADRGGCLKDCHNMEHSPKFKFESYWDIIRH